MPESLENAAQRDTVMDVTEEQIARVYGQAYMGVIDKASNTAELVEELESLVGDVLGKFPQLEEALGSALVSHEEKEGLLDKILRGKASDQLLNFLKVMSAHGRLGILRSVARAVHRLHNEQSGRVEVDLSVAQKLDDKLQQEITATLKQALDAEPELSIHIDPALIAGFVVKVGDTVYDGSIRTRFEQARKAMVARAIEQIETRPETFFNGESG